MPVFVAAVALLGLAFGSFLNVVVYRVPAGMSLSTPGSHCPTCEHPIRRRHNVPVLGWLVLRGRCADCSTRISARYPLVELGTAVLFVVTALQLARTGLLPTVPAYLYLAGAGIALALIDLGSQRLPDAIVLPSYPVLVVLLTAASAVSGDWGALLRAGVGGVACLLGYLLLLVVYPRGMGLGDVKLAGLIGIALGYLSWSALIVGSAAAFVVGGAICAVVLAATARGRGTQVAFGPFMVAGVWIALLGARPISTAYLRLALGA